ncbi:Phosphorylated adapter RNA export protein [Fasciola gigantica]|uniref:Phosphorylated adapter RNA export protein n=1 Tax=Fasciola gigantica TaxID=46835 RepID=A0A504YM99_FASGI|nr:Phosphorylated adapter RNA export protein [Fasciola gigantica]
MAYRVTPISDSSDSQSDEGDIFWKKTPIAGHKRSSERPNENPHKPIKRPRNCVWLNVARDCELSEIIAQTRTYEIHDNSRGPENYLVLSDADEKVDKSDNTSSEIRGFHQDKIPLLRLEDAIPVENMGVDYTSPPELVKETLVRLLNEPNIELLGNVVDTIGVKKSLQFYFLTETVENAGGIYLADGSRRRTKGGVFLQLIRRSDALSKEEKKAALGQNRPMKERVKRKRRQIKKQLEKMMQDQTDRAIDMESHVEESTEGCAQASAGREEIATKTEEMEEGELSSSDEDGR